MRKVQKQIMELEDHRAIDTDLSQEEQMVPKVGILQDTHDY